MTQCVTRPAKLFPDKPAFARAISTFSRMRAPLIVAVNGIAAGAGFSLAMSGDLVIASESASFTMSYTGVGLSPDGSSSDFLPRLIGLRKTQELMFTNRKLGAQEALDWGLINRIAPQPVLLEEAMQLADIFVRGASDSNAFVKELLLATFGNGLETQMEIEGRYIAQCAGSRNGRDGIQAFTQKHPPRFENPAAHSHRNANNGEASPFLHADVSRPSPRPTA